MDIVVQRIKEQRAKLGITQQQLAFDTGLSIGGIQSIETGRAKPNIDTLVKLADRFNCTTDYLLGRDVESIEEKKKTLRKISDTINEFIQFVQETEKAPPTEMMALYIDSLRDYPFQDSTQTKLFLKDPIEHALYMISKISEEFERLDKSEKSKGAQ